MRIDQSLYNERPLTFICFFKVVVMLVLSGLFMDIGMQATMPTLVIGALHDNSAAHLELNDDEASWFGEDRSY